MNLLQAVLFSWLTALHNSNTWGSLS